MKYACNRTSDGQFIMYVQCFIGLKKRSISCMCFWFLGSSFSLWRPNHNHRWLCAAGSLFNCQSCILLNTCINLNIWTLVGHSTCRFCFIYLGVEKTNWLYYILRLLASGSLCSGVLEAQWITYSICVGFRMSCWLKWFPVN